MPPKTIRTEWARLRAAAAAAEMRAREAEKKYDRHVHVINYIYAKAPDLVDSARQHIYMARRDLNPAIPSVDMVRL